MDHLPEEFDSKIPFSRATAADGIAKCDHTAGLGFSQRGCSRAIAERSQSQTPHLPFRIRPNRKRIAIIDSLTSRFPINKEGLRSHSAAELATLPTER